MSLYSSLTFLTLLASGSTSSSSKSAASTYFSFALLALVVGGGYYFLMVKPRQRAMNQQKQIIDAFQPGDEVITIGGIVGIIDHINDDRVWLEISPGVTIEIVRQALKSQVTHGIDDYAESSESSSGDVDSGENDSDSDSSMDDNSSGAKE